jgi:diacylglycerol kinase (ATP)
VRQVVGIRGLLHLGTIKTGLSSGIRLAQCSRVEVLSRKALAMQMDGEPWTQAAGRIVVEHKQK